jgi:hypothetical protein
MRKDADLTWNQILAPWHAQPKWTHSAPTQSKPNSSSKGKAPPSKPDTEVFAVQIRMAYKYLNLLDNWEQRFVLDLYKYDKNSLAYLTNKQQEHLQKITQKLLRRKNVRRDRDQPAA